MKLYASLFFYVAMPACAAEPELLSFGPAQAETVQAGLNIRTISTSGFVLLEHGRSIPLQVSSPKTPSQVSPSVAPVATAADLAQPYGLVDQIKLQTPVARVSGLPLTAPPLKLTASQLQRRRALAPLVSAVAQKHGLPHGLVDAVILAESKYEPHAVSHAGAAGMMQLMPGTAADLGVTNRFSPIANIEAGTRYLRQMIDSLGSVRLGVAAYNAGARSVRRAGGVPNNGETPTYVNRVLGFWNSMSTAAVDLPTGNQPAVLEAGPTMQARQQGIARITVEGTRLASLATELPHQLMVAAK
jgi:Transglycosylase SLT domain